MELIPRILAPLAYLWLFTLLPRDAMTYTKGINFVFIAFASLFSSLWIGSYDKRYMAGGFPFVLSFTRPVSTAWLVAIPLGWLLFLNGAVYLALVALASFLFDVHYPGLTMLPPLLFATTILATISWSTSRVLERLVAAALAIGIGAYWMSPRLGNLDPLWSTQSDFDRAVSFSALEVAAQFAGVLLAFVVLAVLIDRQRHGATEALLNWRSALHLPSWMDPERLKGFRSPRHAQLWFDLRRTSVRAIAIVCVSLLAFMAAALLAAESGDGSLVALMGVAMFQLVPLALLVATVEGMLGLKMRGQQLRLSVFEATLPVTVPGSIGLKLALCTVISLASWAVFAMGSTLIAALLEGGLQNNLRDLLDLGYSISQLELMLWGAAVVGGFAIACPSAVLLFMSLGYAMPQLRDYKAFILPIGLCAFATINLPVFGKLTGWDVTVAGNMLLVCWGLFFVAIALLSLRFALRKRYLGRGLILGVLVLWGGLLSTVFALVWYAGGNFGNLSPYIAVLLAGLLCLPVATMAWAPMTLAALRHQ